MTAPGLGQIRVVWARASCMGNVGDLLDGDERRRLGLLRVAADRTRFAAAHALLRLTVASCTDIDATSLTFPSICGNCGGPHGKPAPIAAADGQAWHTSVAHAGDRVVVAATTVGPVGVDVEAIAATRYPRFDETALARGERAAIRCLPPGERDGARAALWTRKEAVVKATGHGLQIPPEEVVVSVPPDQPALLGWPGGPAPIVWLCDLDVRVGYRGCVALLSPAAAPVAVAERVWAQGGAATAR